MSFQDLAIGSVQQQDLLVTFGALVGSTAVVKTFDTLADKGLIEQNLSRKLIHTTCGPLFILSWLFFTQSQYAKLLSAVIPFLNGLRLFLIGNGALVDAAAVKAVSRKGDRTELLKGPFYYTIILTISTIVFWRDPTGIVALSVMCGGDGLAENARIPAIFGWLRLLANEPWVGRLIFSSTQGAHGIRRPRR